MPGQDNTDASNQVNNTDREFDELLRRAAESAHTAVQEPDSSDPSRRGPNFTG